MSATVLSVPFVTVSAVLEIAFLTSFAPFSTVSSAFFIAPLASLDVLANAFPMLPAVFLASLVKLFAKEIEKKENIIKLNIANEIKNFYIIKPPIEFLNSSNIIFIFEKNIQKKS